MGQPESRLEWKLRLAKSLYDRNYREAQIQELINFIDWLMVLDDNRDARFDEMMRKYEEEKAMPTLSPYQKRFIAKGNQEALRLTLEVRFEPVPKDILDAVDKIDDRNLLMKLQRAAVQVATIDEFRNLLFD